MAIQTKKDRATLVTVVNWILFTLTVFGFVAFFLASFIAFDAMALWIKKNFTQNQGSSRILGLITERKFTNEDVIKVLEADKEENLQVARMLLSGLQIFYGIIGTVAILIQLGLNTLLTLGVRRSDQRKLKHWCWIEAVLLILSVLGIAVRVFNLFIGPSGQPWYLVFTDLASLLWIGYSLWTVREYLDALKGAKVSTDEENADDQQEKPPKKYNDCLYYCFAMCN